MQPDPLAQPRQSLVAGHGPAQARRHGRAGAQRPRRASPRGSRRSIRRRTSAGASTSQTIREQQMGDIPAGADDHDGVGRVRAAHRVRERRQSAARARRRALEGDGGARRAGRRSLARRPPDAHRERHGRARRRGARRRVRVRVPPVDQGEHPRRHAVLDEVHDRLAGAGCSRSAVAVATGISVRARARRSSRRARTSTRRCAMPARAARARDASRQRLRSESRRRRGRVVARAARRRRAADSQLHRHAEREARIRPEQSADDARDADRAVVRLDLQALRVLGSFSARGSTRSRASSSASITNNIPLGGGNNNSFFVVEDQPSPLGSEPLLEIRWVSPRYLETLRIPLRARADVHAAGVGRQRRHRPRGGDQRVHGAAVLEDGGGCDRQAIQVRQCDGHARRGGSRSSASRRTSSTAADGRSRLPGLHAVSPRRLEHGGDRRAHARRARRSATSTVLSGAQGRSIRSCRRIAC